MPDPPGPGPELGALHELAARHHVEAFSEGADGAPVRRPRGTLRGAAGARGRPGRPGRRPGGPGRAPGRGGAAAARAGDGAPDRPAPPAADNPAQRDVHPAATGVSSSSWRTAPDEERLLTAISRPRSAGPRWPGGGFDGYELRLGASRPPSTSPPATTGWGWLESPSLTLSAFLISAPRCPTPGPGVGVPSSPCTPCAPREGPRGGDLPGPRCAHPAGVGGLGGAVWWAPCRCTPRISTSGWR